VKAKYKKMEGMNGGKSKKAKIRSVYNREKGTKNYHKEYTLLKETMVYTSPPLSKDSIPSDSEVDLGIMDQWIESENELKSSGIK
jgi:hypothetical protein